MGGKSTISIGFKIEDADGDFKKLTMDADSLSDLMKVSVTES